MESSENNRIRRSWTRYWKRRARVYEYHRDFFDGALGLVGIQNMQSESNQDESVDS
jgi:hypothetical protein